MVPSVTSELRNRRRAVGLSQQAFAALIGVLIETLRQGTADAYSSSRATLTPDPA
jgi:DNA-binding transcriptional regulator YiaG